MENIQIAYVVKAGDNVATAVDALGAGAAVALTGDVADDSGLTALQDVRRGFKIAVRDIVNGEPIVKYGIMIGYATEDIAKGSCVHIHNMKSANDLRVGAYDTESATPKDRLYYL